jgi:Tol biopolymer transport system component
MTALGLFRQLIPFRRAARCETTALPGTVTAALLSAAIVVVASPAAAVPPGDDGRIAYEYATGTGERAVWSSNADGSDARPIPFDAATMNDASVVAQLLGVNTPSWAPDGRHLAVGLIFNCAYGPNCSDEVGLVDTITGQVRQLTCDGAQAHPGSLSECKSSQHDPAVSTDGATVAFTSTTQVDNTGALVVPMGSLMTVPSSRTCRASEAQPTNCSSAATLLTHDQNATYGPPTWSPDGRWVLSLRSQFTPEIREEIVAVRTDGSRTTVSLTDDLPELYADPEWSPDGTRIMVGGNKTGGNALYTFGISCTTDTCVRSSDPIAFYTGRTYLAGTWSPTGTRAAITLPGGRDAQSVQQDEIATVRLDGTDLTPVTSHAELGAATRSPAWQPLPRTALSVLSVTPQHLASIPARGVTVSATFSRPAGAVTVSIWELDRRERLRPVVGAVSCTTNCTTVTFIPKRPLAPGRYQASVSGTASGQTAQQTWSFTLTR